MKGREKTKNSENVLRDSKKLLPNSETAHDLINNIREHNADIIIRARRK